MAPPDQGSGGASPPAAAALRRQMSCSSSIRRDEPTTAHLERRLSCSSASFSSPAASPASTTYHPAASSTKSSCESIPFADAELAKQASTSSSSTSSYSSFFHADDPDHDCSKYLDFEPSPASSTRPPAVQAMTTKKKTGTECCAPPAYDPKRFPSAMFRTRSTSPAEWSVASNESLFSIRLSNSGDMGDLYFDAAGFPRFPSMGCGGGDAASMMMMRVPSVSGGLCLREDCARCSGAVRKSVRFAATAETVSTAGAAACSPALPQECKARAPETTASGWCQFGCCWPSLPTLWWPRCCAWHCHCSDCWC
ncbi:hypothetical protein QOZ80_5AG0402090 [Eleusine coracana subsp. coracana]|nr:hypothetical protein QOZ80_5AG0402090 [Eleusine coracana subsp. coracana]